MKKTTLALALGILSIIPSAFAQVSYSDTADIDKAHSNIRISDVRYVALPTKTEIREIPGCNPNGEASTVCTEVIVLERQPVVQVTVSYAEGVFRDPDMRESHITFNFRTTDFVAADVNALQAASGLWDFTGRKARVRRAFAKKNLELKTAIATRTIQVVDVANSDLCHEGEAGPLPGCVEVINYKPATIKVRELKILKK